MSITEKYVEFILGYIGNSSLVQLDEPKEGNMVAYHKLGPVITVNVDMKVLSTYSRSANILLTFDKYSVERLFFMPLNSSPVSISNKINKEIDKIVNRTFFEDGRSDEIRERYEKRRQDISDAIQNMKIENEKV